MKKVLEKVFSTVVGKLINKNNRPDSIVGGILAGGGISTILQGGMLVTWEEYLVSALYMLVAGAFLYYKAEGDK